jgi:amino acid permease
LLTASNWAKLCIGITTISLSKSIEQTGIYLSIVGILYVTFVNLYSQYLIIQTRDRFKHSIIVDIPELGVKLFGEKSRVWVSMVPIVENLSYCIAYNIFFG